MRFVASNKHHGQASAHCLCKTSASCHRLQRSDLSACVVQIIRINEQSITTRVSTIDWLSSASPACACKQFLQLLGHIRQHAQCASFSLTKRLAQLWICGRAGSAASQSALLMPRLSGGASLRAAAHRSSVYRQRYAHLSSTTAVRGRGVMSHYC